MTTGTELSTLLSTQNADNINITGGNMSNVTVSACTIVSPTFGAPATFSTPTINGGATILQSVTTMPTGYAGTLTLATTTPVTVSGAAIVVTSAILLSPNTVAVRTTTAPPTVTKIGTGQFEVTGAASDSSVMNWAIIKTV